MNRERQEYLARAFGCGIHEGDTVRVLRAWTEEERDRTGCYWEEDTETLVGAVGNVREIWHDGDFEVDIDDGYFYFPYFVLEKVEDR